MSLWPLQLALISSYFMMVGLASSLGSWEARETGVGWAKGCLGYIQEALNLNQQHTSTRSLCSW